MAIFGFDLENEISVCVWKWELKTWIENLDFETQVWKLWFLVTEQKSNNQLRQKFETFIWLLSLVEKLKYEVNFRLETQIWKPGADLEMKNLEMRSWIPGLL